VPFLIMTHLSLCPYNLIVLYSDERSEGEYKYLIQLYKIINGKIVSKSITMKCVLIVIDGAFCIENLKSGIRPDFSDNIWDCGIQIIVL
jgi:hypothetical protein